MRIKKFEFFPAMVGFFVLLIIALPFIYAYKFGGDQAHFAGFLVNPLDGNSYLAKMRQGWEGSWHFRLPFTADPGDGAYLNLFYLALGHISRFLDLPLMITFHAARLFSAAILLRMLWYFYGRIFQNHQTRRLAYAVSAFGSGMGWLLLPWAHYTSDFLVAESYPFLSGYTNPHFSIGMACMLWIIAPSGKENSRQDYLRYGPAALLLSVCAPFGIIISLTILGSRWLWQATSSWRNQKNFDFPHRALAVLTSGIPFLVYDYWVIKNDPVFTAWDLQNQTLSPAWWDVLISLSPAIPIVIITLWKAKKRAEPPSLLLLWLGIGLTLIYIPWNLQRRFMMGLYIPVAGLVAWSFYELAAKSTRYYHLRVAVLFFLILPTNFIIIMTSLFGVKTLDEKIYISQSELHALKWLDEHTDSDALVLSGLELGLWIPVYSGQRVIYGHPFETTNAETEKEIVQKFFSGTMSGATMQSLIDLRGVDFIFVGPRELSMGNIDLSTIFTTVYSSDDITVFETVSSVYE
ncbi:MAG: hypothetical protein IZT55_07085 [Anaerolineae bacterium]|nr:hypothetical protein [Anaerolineae bacterium]